MSSFDQLAKDLYKTISESDDKKVKPYDTKAEVLRVEGNTVWVKIPGGIDETPVQRTNNATPGDTVMVRVAGGRAWVAGNNTSPATDDTVANIAYDVGMGASVAANRAIDEASRAMIAADQAEVEAGRAKQAADTADENASMATLYANSALYGLSVVQDVVGTVEWVTDNSFYVWVGTGQFVHDTKYYYTNSLPTEPIAIITLDTINKQAYEPKSFTTSSKTYGYYEKVAPVNSLDDIFMVEENDEPYSRTVKKLRMTAWYEKEGETYIFLEQSKTHTIPPYTTHYGIEFETMSNPPSTEWSIYCPYVLPEFIEELNPEESDIKNYYTSNVQTAMSDYIKSHLVLTDDGLSLISDNNKYRVLLATDGLKIVDPNGKVVGLHGETIQLGPKQEIHFEATSTALKFTSPGGDICWFGKNENNIWEMHIANSHVEDIMRYGDYAFIKRENGNMSLKWLGE